MEWDLRFQISKWGAPEGGAREGSKQELTVGGGKKCLWFCNPCIAERPICL